MFKYLLKLIPSDQISKAHSYNKKQSVYLINYIIFLVYFFFTDLNLFIWSLPFLFIGYFDDLFNLKVNYRFLLASFLLILFYYFNQSYILDVFFYSNNQFNFIFILGFSLTIFLSLGFFHVMNMIDGRNCHFLIYLLFSFLVIDQNSNEIYPIFYFCIFLMFIFNYFNIFYLGNSGVLLISFILSALLFKNYLLQLISAKEIFIIFFIPFFDTARLSIKRIINKKSPFNPDQDHLHHYPNNWNLALTIIFLNIALLLFITQKTIISFAFLIFFTILNYYLLIKLFKRI